MQLSGFKFLRLNFDSCGLKSNSCYKTLFLGNDKTYHSAKAGIYDLMLHKWGNPLLLNIKCFTQKRKKIAVTKLHNRNTWTFYYQNTSSNIVGENCQISIHRKYPQPVVLAMAKLNCPVPAQSVWSTLYCIVFQT